MLFTALLLLACALSAFVADWLGLPLPYMLGPLVTSGLISLGLNARLPGDFSLLGKLRFVFIAVIGVMIGAQVTPALLGDPGALALSAGALVIFIALCLGFNYCIFRRLGGYDRATAFYAAMPGGLYESISMGEEAGADLARLMLQQFLRVIAVVTLVPIGLSLWLGHSVGSAGGMSLARPDVPWQALPVVALAILAGIALGRLLRLPARQLTGPMAVGAALSLSGAITLDIPQWLINLALIVVGTALGTRFHGASRGMMTRALGLALVSVTGMLIITAPVAMLVAHETGQRFDIMLVAFAPGGVTEMTLVALSLSGNPAIVTLHHIARILITVALLTGSAGWLRRRL